MSLRFQPIVRSGPVDQGVSPAQPLAGAGALWFRDVQTYRAGRMDAQIAATALAPDTLARLTAPRADLCGLSLDRPRIMGILNVTPDSFSDGGAYLNSHDAVARARVLAQDADILDIGGESTRPGAKTVPDAEEIKRTAPVIRAIRDAGITTPISIDTRKSAVALAALEAGANMVNDVSALVFDPGLAALVAERAVPLCLMHAQGRPENMQANPTYDAVLFDVFDQLEQRIQTALSAGIGRNRLIVDPGIGFGKNLKHNVTLLRHLSLYHDLGLPILLGTSRKRFIDEISGAALASDRVAGSVATALHGAAQGAQILRVHDTFETRQALNLFEALNKGDISDEN